VAPPPRAPHTPFNIERLIVWVASGLGGLMVLLATLFALKVAIDKGIFGPGVRVGAGLTFGTLIWIIGVSLRQHKYRWLVSALSGAGMGVLYGTLFAAVSLYHLLPGPAVFVAMVAITAVAIGQAVRFSDRFMAHLGLLGGILTPVLVSSGENRPIALFSYLALLTAGGLVVARRRGWADLVGMALFGVVVLYLGWSERWHQPDQAPIALVAAGLLSSIFAWAGRAESVPTRVLGMLGAALVAAMACLWVGPIDPLFVDPRNGLLVTRTFGDAPMVAAAALALLPLPLLLLARRAEGTLPSLLALGTSALLQLVFAVGWSNVENPPLLALSAGALLPFVLAALLQPRRDHTALLTPWPAVAGLMLTLALGGGEDRGPYLAGGIGLLCLWSVGAAVWTRQGWMLLASALGGALPLLVASLDVGEVGAGWVAAAALLAYATHATGPLLPRWHDQGQPITAIAALAPLLYFLPLYRCWEIGLGDPVIGMLPIGMGLMSLLGAAVLLRVHRVTDTDGGLALFIGVSLLGLSAALPIQLRDQWLTVAWALEGLALAWLSGRLRHPLIPVASVVLAVTVGVRLIVNPWALEYGDSGGLPIFNWTLYTWGLPAICMMASAHLLGERVPRWVRGTLVGMSLATGFVLVNVQVSDFFQDEGPIELGGKGVLQGMVRSLAWGAYGVLVLGGGVWRDSRAVRLAGFSVVMMAAAKVFILDLWELSGFVRVGSVLGLGVTLLVAAFLFERIVLRKDNSSNTPAGDA
jgi:uncharacterized membrane protein